MIAPTRSHKTVAAFVTLGMRRWAVWGGVDPAEFDRLTGFRPELAVAPDARVEKPVHDRVLALLARVPYPADAALHSPDRVAAADPLFAAAWSNGRTARDALGAFLTFRPLLGEPDRLTYRQDGRSACVEYISEGPPEAASRQALAHFAMVRALVARHARERRPAVGCALTGPAFLDRDVSREALGVDVAWDAPANRLLLPQRLMDVPAPGFNAAVDAVVRAALRRRLARLRGGASLAARVETLTASLLTGDAPEASAHRALERVCGALGVSRWTLRRRLAEERVSFEALWARARELEGERLLRETALPIASIAARLGYSDGRAFSRFFRARRGCAPGVLRRSGSA